MRRDWMGVFRRVRWHLGVEGYESVYTRDCTGCTDYGDYGVRYGPYGCHECGYTGKRVERNFIPFDERAYQAALAMSALDETRLIK